jgi:hypothetical protein
MNYDKVIKQLASSMTGTSKYFDCPACGKKVKLGITIKPEGILYHCFSNSCKLNKARLLSSHLTASSMAQILNRKGKEHREATFEPPQHLIGGFASETGLRMAANYDLMEAYLNKMFKTAYDPRLERQVFYYRNENNAVVGAMGRALRAHHRPKAYIYPGSIKTPWICGTSQEAILCEDVLSAVKAYNIGKTGIALSGTTLALEYLDTFKKYKKVYVALDKDASMKSLEIKKLLDVYVKEVKIVLLERDLKDLTREQVKILLDNT